MAPEVIKHCKQGYGQPADIWSFGCTNIEMATAQIPFANCSTYFAAIFHIGKHEKPPQIPKEMSTVAKNFISRCFVVDADKRPTAAQLLEDPFLSDKFKMSRSVSASV